ncbi:hydrolase 1, exosortase A system-associated [Aquabacterium lacunae]|uniref:Hydrolase 1, exosortase A system-associated n=2 Tax=Aquabacterium lacunae TaxID=2528630 RepID=A0A4Q9H2V1_9BURK|nr:hydrolase 1, exosortase A system-associated [Aquabacterium lacunae]
MAPPDLCTTPQDWVSIDSLCFERAVPLTLSPAPAIAPIHSMAILSRPARAHRSGICVVMLSGGLQARTGAHRMFTTLARALAANGHSAVRFDWPGLGDADGSAMPFEQLAPMLPQLQQQCLAAMPDTDRIVWLGLCDGASVALMHLADPTTVRPDALILLNPWVRSEQSQAQTVVRHYYKQRLLEGSFWRKLLSGQVGLDAARSASRLLRASRQRTPAQPGFQQQMAKGWKNFGRPLWLVVAGQDLTGLEFMEHAGRDLAWRGALEAPAVHVSTMAGADHTFSGSQDMPELIRLMMEWLSAQWPQGPN